MRAARRFSISSLSAAIHQDFGAQTCFITARLKLLSYDSIPVCELVCTVPEQASFGIVGDNALEPYIRFSYAQEIHILNQTSRGSTKSKLHRCNSGTSDISKSKSDVTSSGTATIKVTKIVEHRYSFVTQSCVSVHP